MIPDQEDILLWADGTSCFRYEMHEMSHMSDDYEVIPFNTLRWRTIVIADARNFFIEEST